MKPSRSIPLTPGRLVYLTVHLPLGLLRRSCREGGPVNQWITARAQQSMHEAAFRLPPLPLPAAHAPEVFFLTGRRFWYQTAFCLWSLGRHAGAPLRAVFHDDGTFDDRLRAESARVFPGSRVEGAAEIEARLDAHLPGDRYPTLRARRLVYPNLRKLTDVHAGGRGWKLVLDSDMLFFRRPAEMLSWLQAPGVPLHMADVKDSYGYPSDLLEAIAGRVIPSRLNVGVCGLRSETIDWDRLEAWNRQLHQSAGTSYYEEQALIAMMLAGSNAQCLPSPDYLLMPSETECLQPTAVMHHYVDLSKRGYFRHAWRHVVPSRSHTR